MQTQSKGHTYTNPWRGQYLMHAHSHITQAVAGGKAVAVGVMNRENPCLQNPYRRGECKAVYQVLAPHNTCGSCWLGTVQQFYHDMRGEGGSRVTSKLKQGAHIHQPTALPLPHAHAWDSHITRAVEAMDSCFALTGAHHHGIAIGQ